MEKLEIAFIQTGGTIDKDYPKKTGGYAFEIDVPAYDRILKKLKQPLTYKSYSFLRKDSLEITEEDRKKLRDFIILLKEDKIIITHGTDTLIETAKSLLSIEGKTIVLTGSKLPERFSDSDAPINLGVALGAVQSLSQGVYVSMQGIVMPAKAAERDNKTGDFYLSEV